MATKVKPSRLQVSGTPQVGQVPVYVDEDTFQWGAGGGGGTGDVSGPASSTDGNIVLFDGATGKIIKDSGVGLSSKLDAAALSNNAYGGAWNGDTTHTPTKDALYDKIHTMDVEIGNKAADTTVVKLTGNQTIAGTKTFSTSPVVPSKTTDATNTGTAIATEAQVYKVDSKVSQLFGLGKFLSLWNATTGLPTSFPLSTPYTYSTGDYFLVGTVSTATPPVNYKPTGSSYSGTASTTTESEELEVGDIYIYDGSTWLLQLNHGKTVSFSEIAGDPYDNSDLSTALGAKQDELVSGTNIRTINGTSILGSGDITTPVGPTYTAGTGISIVSDAINNTGVTSINGNTGAVTVNDVKSSATAPSSPTEGMVWYDTTNDQLKVYDGTNWNVTGKEYNAGTGIEIKNGPDYSAMQGPAPSGFHVPLDTEWTAVKTVWTTLGGGSSDGTNFGIALKLPFAGYRSYYNANVGSQGSRGYYWSSSRYDADNAYHLDFYSGALVPQNIYYCANGYSVRCFKDVPTVPTSSWTKLYGTSIESGGIFWSSTDGLISLSSDGQTWVTIADKNLGATTVWNSGDALSEANCGKYYQRGNNYGFLRTGTIANQSTTQVDASNYGPGNYYSSDTFIKYSGSRDSSGNGNLWGGVTGVVTFNNAITNTGVLSVNGQTGNVTVSGGIQLAPNTELNIKYHWYGSQASYDSLNQYYTDTAGDTAFFTVA